MLPFQRTTACLGTLEKKKDYRKDNGNVLVTQSLRSVFIEL